MSVPIIQNVSQFKYKVLSYFFGFMLSIVLTFVPFILVYKNYFNLNIKLFIIILFSLIQIIVHLKYFLHLTFSKVYYWNLVFLIFSIIVMFIIIFGSIWIMHNLNHDSLKHIYV